MAPFLVHKAVQSAHIIASYVDKNKFSLTLGLST